MNNRAVTDWALLSLAAVGAMAAAVLYVLKTLAVLWFQSVAQTSQALFG